MVRRSLAILGSITVLLTALSSDAGWAAPAANHTIVLQQGLTGYTGVRDTWVSDLDWDTPPQYAANYGTNESLMLDRDGGQNPLLRFDVTGIPANSEIVSATLSLYNNTPSCYGGCTDPYVRRVKLYTVLQDWDEGNQVNSPIDEAGKHGATGEHAFDYFAGEGTDVAWQARGMAAGTDYAAAEKSQADIISQGWYHWDVTSLVRDWVRGEAPNFGMVLRDATGWEDRNTDWREFFSSQHASDPSRRPKLTVTYNPDVPFADAGTDQENLHWTGAATALDGSASHDRPGGNDATLSYEWRIQTAAYDSVLSGVIGRNAALNFTPDRAGEWTFALAVTNAVGERRDRCGSRPAAEHPADAPAHLPDAGAPGRAAQPGCAQQPALDSFVGCREWRGGHVAGSVGLTGHRGCRLLCRRAGRSSDVGKHRPVLRQLSRRCRPGLRLVLRADERRPKNVHHRLPQQPWG